MEALFNLSISKGFRFISVDDFLCPGQESMSAGKNLVVVEDDPDIRLLLERCLKADGYHVISLPAAAGLDEVLSSNDVALVIVDVGLPDADGLTVTRRIRQNHDLGIIIVSGRGDLTDRVVGLEVGADDYITKPFEPREVLARVRSVLRRGERTPCALPTDKPHRKYSFNGCIIDMTSQTLTDGEGQMVALTSGEYKLLETFVTHANRVLTRDQLLDYICANDAPAFDRSIDVRIGRLRKKINDDPKHPTLIKTVRNSGYIFSGIVSAA
ncbi:MAG TPA: response regulator transcription factor [Rhizomicrobium sp.]|nr:response regulator transcription factor [Rhizomicrobium sp.]